MLDYLSDKNPATKSDRLTPLHLAAQEGHVAICKLIMDNLKDKNPKCSSGATPLNLATSLGKLKTGSDRIRQDQTGSDRIGQDRTGLDRSGQDRTGVDRSGQDRTGAD